MIGYITRDSDPSVLEFADEMVHLTLTREIPGWPFEIEGPDRDKVYDYHPGETDITDWILKYTASGHTYTYIFDSFDLEKNMWKCRWPD